MKHLRLFLTHLLLLLTLWVGAAGFDKATYYSAANGKKGEALKTALAGIIYRQNAAVSYDGLKSAYTETDVRSDNKLYDIYSQITNYTPGSAFASSYSKEGDGYNREHLIPQSLFSEASPMVSDLQHVYPSDAKMNGVRNNYCHGNVGTIINTQGTPAASGNFCYLGTPASTLKSNGCTEDYVFEPNDIYKGDIARVYFYFVTCYETKIKSWGSKWSSYGMFDGSTYPAFSNWAKIMLLEWSENDVVSQKEITRNDAVYNYPSSGSNNRNPFIDYPGLEQYIWGSYTNVAFDPDNYQNPYNSTPPTPTPSITLSPTTASVVVGHTVTLAAKIENANGATVTWSSNNSNVATVLNGVVTGVTEGEATITARITGTNYTATCIVTVTDNTSPVVEGDTYVKVTSTSDLTNGQYLIVYEDGSLAFNGGLGTLDVANNGIAVTINDGQIKVTENTESAEFTIDVNSGTIKSASGFYIGNTSNSNGLLARTSLLTNTITISNNEATIVSSGGAYLRYNAASDQKRFRYYKSASYTNLQPIQLYKKTSSGSPTQPIDPTISFANSTVSLTVGDTYTQTVSTNSDGAVSYSSSTPSVATVSNTGQVTALSAGTTTITASVSATSSYNAASVSYSINVSNAASPYTGSGTQDDPYTISDVLLLFTNNEKPTTEIYAKGIITRITSLNTSQYTNARYYISDDASSSNEFYVYNGKYLNGADFTSDDQIQVGDEVVIYGKLTTYGTTNEFAANNYIVSLNRPSDVLLGDVNKDGDITIADVTALVNIILGKANGPKPLYNHDAADVNGDGGITIADVTALVNIILGKTN